MDICVLNPFFYPEQGGTENVLLEVYSRLARKHNITVISGASTGTGGRFREYVHGIEVVRLRTRHIHTSALPMPFLVMYGIKDAIRLARADLYHINNRYQYFMGTLHTIRSIGARLALTLHNALPKGIGPFTDAAGSVYDALMGRRIMHAADIITAVSTYTARSTVPSCDMGKTHVIYNGVDCRRFRKRDKRDRNVKEVMRAFGINDNGAANLMSNGRLIPQKGQLYLLRAVGELIRSGVELNLFILGNGPMLGRLHREAHAQGIKRFSVFVADMRSVPYCYNAADVFVAPSLYEPASMALLEALASGVPAVASRVGGMPEMGGRACLYTMPRSVSGIKKHVEKVLGDASGAAARAREGRRLMVREHNWDAIARKYEEVFESAVRR